MPEEEIGIWSDSSEFPQNLTLYVDQFTDSGADKEHEQEVFHATNLENTFIHFKPEKSVLLRNEAGELAEETFSFNNIEDFEDEHLIAQSELLKTLSGKIEACNRIIQQLEKNKVLRNVLNDSEAYQCLKDHLEALLTDPKKGQPGIQPSETISKYGGDRFLKRIIPNGLVDPNPELRIWNVLLAKQGETPEELVKACVSFRNEAEQCLQNNLAVTHDEIRRLEVSYRALETFFDNAGQGNVDCLTLMNLNKERYASIESDGIVVIENELKKHYDALSLKNSYSLLVAPGNLGDTPSLMRWAELAYNNKVLMVTDFKDCRSFKTLKEELEEAHLQDSDVKMSNLIMTCNYILGRKKSDLSDEDDDVYLPGAGALAGRLCNVKQTGIAQGVVGKDHGFLNNVKGTRLNLLKSEVAILIAQGVIPLSEVCGQTFALSNRSLYNGASVSLQEYPIVRVLDWVNKVLMNYMHDIALETWDPYVSPQKLEAKIRGFLDHCRSYQLLFSNYKLSQPTQDPKSKIVTVDVSVTPFYSSKNIIITLEADNKNYLNADTNIE